MKDDKDDMNYSTDYLRKYLNGELTDKEMQALEKAALEDPFLSDAIDGLQEAGNLSSFESDVAELRNRLNKRVQKEKKKRGIIFMFPRWQVAASILIIVAITTFTITFIKNTATQNSISSVNKKDTQQVVVSRAPAAVQTNSDTIAIEGKTKSRELNPIAKSVDQNKTTVANQQKMKYPVASEVQEDKKSVATIPPVNAPMADKGKLKKEDTLHYVQGIVKDDSGRAIASATVRLTGQDKAVATDTNGYFKLYLNKNKKDQEIAINSVGFKTVNANVAPDSSLLNFRMQNASDQLNEVVVTGYGTQKRRDVTGSVTPVTIKTLKPQGWQAMNNYINENKKIIDADSVLKGEEVISFEVNKKGKLSSFKVIKSISSSHDAEVIRLLKSGPPLLPENGKKQKCQISIIFN